MSVVADSNIDMQEADSNVDMKENDVEHNEESNNSKTKYNDRHFLKSYERKKKRRENISAISPSGNEKIKQTRFRLLVLKETMVRGHYDLIFIRTMNDCSSILYDSHNTLMILPVMMNHIEWLVYKLRHTEYKLTALNKKEYSLFAEDIDKFINDLKTWCLEWFGECFVLDKK